MTNVAVILAGCGYLDGAEIREAVITLLALDRAGAKVQCFAPDVPQMHVVDHRTGKEVAGESRNVLAESARIARGQIRDLKEAKAAAFDALVLPGGYGAAKNLSDLAVKGAAATVLPDYKRLVTEFVQAGKPIGAICISPAVLTAALKETCDPTVTIGQDADGLIAGLGGHHQSCPTTGVCVDAAHKIVSCPAYMSEARLADVATGIEGVVRQVMEWVGTASGSKRANAN